MKVSSRYNGVHGQDRLVLLGEEAIVKSLIKEVVLN